MAGSANPGNYPTIQPRELRRNATRLSSSSALWSYHLQLSPAKSGERTPCILSVSGGRIVPPRNAESTTPGRLVPREGQRLPSMRPCETQRVQRCRKMRLTFNSALPNAGSATNCCVIASFWCKSFNAALRNEGSARGLVARMNHCELILQCSPAECGECN